MTSNTSTVTAKQVTAASSRRVACRSLAAAVAALALVTPVAGAVSADAGTPASAKATPTDLRSPDARDAASPTVATTFGIGTDLRSPDARDAASPTVAVTHSVSDLRSPDAADAASTRVIAGGRARHVAFSKGTTDAQILASRGVGAPTKAHASVASAKSDDNGIDWNSVGIAGAIAGGLLVLLAAGFGASQRVRVAR